MHDETVSSSDAPIGPGALGAWWREGARTALLRAPRWAGLQTTPAIVACLFVVPLLLGLGIERLYIDGPAGFHWPALQLGWWSTALTVWVCWLIVPRAASADRMPIVGDAGPPRHAPSAAAMFSMLAAQALTLTVVLALVFVPLVRSGAYSPEVLGEWGWRVAMLLPLGWVAAAQIALVWRGAAAGLRRRAVAALVLLGAIALGEWVLPVHHWYPQAQADERTEPLRVTQELLELQPQLLSQQLQGLQRQRPGIVDVYSITFAPYAEEDVFRNESALVDGVMQQRFGAAGRSIQLVNHRDTARERPWATPLNLQRTIARVGELMDRDEDLLFVHLTSHGAQNGTLSAYIWPLTVDGLTPAMLKTALDAAGVRWRVLSVSACYSGSWIAPLADSNTLVMTAADAEHTSYGCGKNSELTFFGRAMFYEELRRTWSFEDAHARARDVIARREREAGKQDGYSNPQIAVGAALRAPLARLQAQRAAAAASGP